MANTFKKLVILDRDGVINYDSKSFIKSNDEWIPYRSALEAIVHFKKSNFIVCVATNQSGISRGLYTINDLELIHEKMHYELKKLGAHIDLIVFCPHGPLDNCECRKPKTGLFVKISKHFNSSLKDVPAIGDSVRDLQAAHAVGSRPILVRTGNGKSTEDLLPTLPFKVEVFDDLLEVALYLTSI